jgi:hypothetical protein
LAAFRYRAPALLFLGVFLFSGLSRISASGDSRWTVYTAMSLWRHGTTDVDDYPSAIRDNGFYALQCIDGQGRITRGPLNRCDGHWYSLYPIGGPVLTAPLIIAMVESLKAMQPLLGHLHASGAATNAFLHADFDAAHALIEMEIASLLLAATAVMLYFIARRQLPQRRAVVLALLFALATSAYSTGGRALWQHAPSMLLLAATIYLLLRAEEHPALAAWAGIPVALSYTVRPTDALFVAVITAYVAVRHRAMLPRYLLAAAPIAAVFFAYNLSIYHAFLSPYYRSRVDGFLPRNWPTFGEALTANLVSPSRGIFIFTPVFLFAVWSMIRRKWKAPLAPWLAVLALLHWLVISSFVQNWWGGHSYGPRFFTDLTPVFVLFLIPYFQSWGQQGLALRAAFVALALVGLAIHLRGGWSPAVYRWNVDPVNIDQSPERVWEWSDPQFLRR